MLTLNELNILLNPEIQDLVKTNIEADPNSIALDKKMPHALLVATQVKLLQKARKKLPSYYKAQCLLSPKAFEQASSEASAAHRHYSGEFCLDLGSGLGVDSYYLSKHFDRIICIERDPLVAEMARVNLELLGRDNVSVVKMDIVEALETHPTLSADLIFMDPDRRSENGKRAVTLADCSPNVEKLLPMLRRLAPKLVIKLSPLFDVDEAFRVFGPHTDVEVISHNGECKEVLVETDMRIESPVIRATGLGKYEVEYQYGQEQPVAPDAPMPALTSFRYLIIPDVAMAKARIAVRYFRDRGDYIETDHSYAFSNSALTEHVGKMYEIESVERYSPKKLQEKLKAMKATKINILKHDFPYSNDKVAKELGVREGGTRNVAFTTAGGKKWAVFLK